MKKGRFVFMNALGRQNLSSQKHQSSSTGSTPVNASVISFGDGSTSVSQGYTYSLIGGT